MKEQILQLKQEGKSYRQIQKLLGCSKGTISYHLGEGQKGKHRETNARRKAKAKEWMKTVKEKLSCSTCGEARWWLLDFHHRDPLEKEYGIAQILKGKKEVILKEIAKCDVLCSNCHRDLHYQQQQAAIAQQVEATDLKSV